MVMKRVTEELLHKLSVHKHNPHTKAIAQGKGGSLATPTYSFPLPQIDVSGQSTGAQQFGSQRRILASNSFGIRVITWISNTALEKGIFVNVAPNFFIGNLHVGSTGLGDFDPTVGINDSGQFVVAWANEDDQHRRSILAQRFEFQLVPVEQWIPVGQRFPVTDSSIPSASEPTLAINADGSFVVAFTVELAGGRIMARFFDSNGQGQDHFVLISDEPDDIPAYQASLASNGAGTYVIAFAQENAPSFPQVVAKRFDANGNSIGTQIAVGESNGISLGAYKQTEPSVGMASNGIFGVAFTNLIAENGLLGDLPNRPIYRTVTAYVFEPTNQTLTFGGQVSNIGTDSYEPSLGMDSEGTIAVAYTTGYSFQVPDQSFISTVKAFVMGNKTFPFISELVVPDPESQKTDSDSNPSLALSSLGSPRLWVAWLNNGLKFDSQGRPSFGVFSRGYGPPVT
jgi:hypothetical protein